MAEVVVITGAGGMGIACARRLGPGRRLLIADFDDAKLQIVTSALQAEGYFVEAQHVDVSDRASVNALAATASAMGSVRTIVHSAGLSPTMASPARGLALGR